MKDWKLFIKTRAVNAFDIEKYTDFIRDNDGVVYLVTTDDEDDCIYVTFKSSPDVLRELDAKLKEDNNIYAHMLMRRGE